MAIAATDRLDLLGVPGERHHLGRSVDADGLRCATSLEAPAVEAVAAREVEDARAAHVGGELLERVGFEVDPERLLLRLRVAIADAVVFRELRHAASGFTRRRLSPGTFPRSSAGRASVLERFRPLAYDGFWRADIVFLRRGFPSCTAPSFSSVRRAS